MPHQEDRFARAIRELETAAQDLSIALKELSTSLNKLKLQADTIYQEHGAPFGDDDRALAVWLEHECWVTPN
jgi:hypothetical protein